MQMVRSGLRLILQGKHEKLLITASSEKVGGQHQTGVKLI